MDIGHFSARCQVSPRIYFCCGRQRGGRAEALSSHLSMDIFLRNFNHQEKYIFAFPRMARICLLTIGTLMPCSAAYAVWLFPSMRHSRKIERWLSVSVLQNASVSSAVSTSESMRCRVSHSHAASSMLPPSRMASRLRIGPMVCCFAYSRRICFS